MNTLKLLRQELKLTQSDLAHALNVTPAAISRIEAGVRPLTDRMAHQIATEFNVSEDWLRTGEGEMFPLPSSEDDELIGYFADLTAGDVSPERKRFINAFIRITSDLDDAQLYALGDVFANFADALRHDADADKDDKKDES